VIQQWCFPAPASRAVETLELRSFLRQSRPRIQQQEKCQKNGDVECNRAQRVTLDLLTRDCG
jgi:hypothetical protein